MQKNETGPLSYTIHKVNLKWIKDVNVRPETIKILEESTGSNFSNIDHSNIFLEISTKTRETKAKINYWDYTKVSFHTGTEIINKKKKKATF